MTQGGSNTTGMTQKIRIKDIAERSGVSVGTVDRVLHNRPNVSRPAREKVEKALKEMNYQPNMYASALAYNKQYVFYCIMPEHASIAYWEEIEHGIAKAVELRRDFHIEVRTIYYRRLDAQSFAKSYAQCLSQNPDGVILVPAEQAITRTFTDQLHEQNIPFVLLDSYIPELRPLSFFGQDSFQSGYFAAKMLMLIASDEKEIMLMKQTKNGRVGSRQQASREEGFRHYMKEHFPEVRITELDLPMDEERQLYDGILEDFFARNPQIHHCATLASKAHIVGEFLLDTGRSNVQIMGYDLVGKNVACVKRGSISFLIAQHAYMQGYSCVETLFRSIVLKKEVRPINYMPIELIMKENIDFYKRDSI